MIWLLHAALANSALTLEVRGLSETTGQVLCTLYDSEARWLKDPGYVATAKATPQGTTATCVFPNVAAGMYAVSFIHDVNGNDDMDTNWLGLPKEPWGFSRDAPVTLGPPAFDQAAFEHPGPVQVAHAR